MKIVSYEHSWDGGYADTVGVTDDGKRLHINTQYRCVLHQDGSRIVDCAAILADAKLRGKFGAAPVEQVAGAKYDQDGHDAVVSAMTLGGRSI